MAAQNSLHDEKKAASVLRQVEYYFSDSNLARDKFLRETIDSSQDGLVSLALICAFNKMRGILGLENDTKPEDIPADMVDDVSDLLRSRSTTLRISEDGKTVGRNAELFKLEQVIEQLDSRTIAASPFPYDITREDVEALFSKQAKVTSVRLPKHVSDKRYFCGTALVEFSEEEDAKKMLNETLMYAGAELTFKPKKEYDEQRAKQKEEHEKKSVDKGPSYPKGVVISFQLEKKRKSSDTVDSTKIEPEDEKVNSLDSNEKPTVEEPQDKQMDEVKGENNESAKEKAIEEGHDGKSDNAESISNGVGGTQITREDLKEVFGKFGNVKYIDFSMGQESGYIRYEDSKGVETARAMAEVSDEGGLLVKNHIATVQAVAGEDEEKYWKELQEKRESRFDNARGGGRNRGGGRREFFGKHGKHGRRNDSNDRRPQKTQRVN